MRYLVTGGGTGGHIYPALAICKGLMQHDLSAEIVYVGTKKGLEAQIVPREGIPFETIDVMGIMGKSAARAARGAMSAFRSTFYAMALVRRIRPDVAIGTGGYVSGPVILAARLLGVPTAIQEQNAVPGVTNKLLSRVVSKVFVPFPGTEDHFPARHKCVLTGNPVRPEILAAERDEGRQQLGLDPNKRVLCVFGGSRGARKLVEVAIEMLELGLLPEGIQVLLVTGNEYEFMAKERLSALGIGTSIGGDVIVKPYLFEMQYALAASDLILGRAGGMTVSEILARGLPSIIVPSPNVAQDHQFYNARVASKTGGAILMKEQELSARRLGDKISEILTDDLVLSQMAAKARTAGRPHATREIVKHIQALTK